MTNPHARTHVHSFVIHTHTVVYMARLVLHAASDYLVHKLSTLL